MKSITKKRADQYQNIRSGLFAFLLFGTIATGQAGEEETTDSLGHSNAGNWCSSLKSIGKRYSNPTNPWIQEVNLAGRFHYQVAHVDGQVNGNRDFNYDTDEVRRFRLGGNARFFHHLTLSGQANIFDDQGPVGGKEGFEFAQMFDLFALVDLKGAFDLDGFDALAIGYGIREVNMSNEGSVSSKNIKTIERSAIANKILAYDSESLNPTGVWIDGKNGELAWILGVFSTTQDYWLAPWDDGVLYHSRVTYDFSKATGADISKISLAHNYQDLDAGDEVLSDGIGWSSSLSLNVGNGPWELMIDGIYGNNGDQVNAAREGDFWGVVIMPSYWLQKDKLEAVFRYQYEGSDEDQGIRVFSRYSRRADVREGLGMLNGGRGDEHHSYYVGLNYYLCGNNAKLMAGVQYDDISSNGADVYDGWTSMLAFRTFF